MELFLTRSMVDLKMSNVLNLGLLRIRFQLAPGNGADLGIADAEYTVGFDGQPPRHKGKTDAGGELQVPVMDVVFGGAPLIIEILGTRYALQLHPGLEPIRSLAGLQKRLDALGYLTGYQLEPIGDAKPDDGIDGPRTQQAIMNFQMDNSLVIDGDLGPQTTGALETALDKKEGTGSGQP